MQWLRAEGIELVNLGQYQTNVLSPPWRNGAGFKWDGYAGDVTLRKLEANLTKRGGACCAPRTPTRSNLRAPASKSWRHSRKAR